MDERLDRSRERDQTAVTGSLHGRERILVFHTAFIGDVVLALPLVQALKQHAPGVKISFVATPAAAGVLANHPAIDHIIEYDKHKGDRGLSGMLRLARLLGNRGFDLALIPHRSLRSALMAWLARIPRRIGFANSAGRWLLTERVEHVAQDHEIDRDLRLLQPLGIAVPRPLPQVHPSAADSALVSELLAARATTDPDFAADRLVGLAPGSIWYTKRWLPERFVELGKHLKAQGHSIALIGGGDDVRLCAEIAAAIGHTGVLDTSGKLSLLQSAALMRRCRVIVANDSAPMHLAVAVRTPVIAIFGATVPQFGFAPLGERDIVIETNGLACRPCGIHGGRACPIGTFDCMTAISAQQVASAVQDVSITTSPER